MNADGVVLGIVHILKTGYLFKKAVLLGTLSKQVKI